MTSGWTVEQARQVKATGRRRALARWGVVAIACCAALLSACVTGRGGGGGGDRPETLSSAASLPYAEGWTPRVRGLADRFDAAQAEAFAAFDAMPTYPDALKDDKADWAKVEEAFVLADKAGRSQAVVETLRTHKTVKRFIDTNAQPMSRRMAIHINSVIKKKGNCKYDTGGASFYALQNATDRQMSEELETVNEAHRFIKEHEDALGKGNTDTLREQADAVTLTSYFVHIELLDIRANMARLVGEMDQVQETLKAESAKLRKEAEETQGLSRGQRRAMTKRADELDAMVADMTLPAERARVVVDNADEVTEQLQTKYAASFDKLKKAAAAKASK